MILGSRQVDDLNCHGAPSLAGTWSATKNERSPGMRTRLLAVTSLAVVLMALAVPARAAGAETLHVSFKGQTAQAEFSATQRCVQTVVYVLASDGRFKTDPGGPEAASGAEIYIFGFDVCTQTQLLAAFGFAVLAPDEFQIDEQFTAASLATTIEVSDDVSGTSFPVAVSVSWTGFGDTFSQDDRFHLKEPGLKVNFHLDGTFREATASGTVTDGTTNLTPEPALVTGNTRLGSIRVGEVDIIHQ
jgi:hypothetical protein